MLKDRVTSLILNESDSHFLEKKSALEQFYPFLLTALKSKPEWISIFQNNLNPRLADLFAGHSELKDNLLSAISPAIPKLELENLLSKSIPSVLGVLEDEAGSSDPSIIEEFLNKNMESIDGGLAPWARAILGTLGLGGIAASVKAGFGKFGQTVGDLTDSAQTDIKHIRDEAKELLSEKIAESEKKSSGSFWPALIALAILLGLALWGLRSCKNNDVAPIAPPSQTQSSEVKDAVLNITTDANGELRSCEARVGDAGFIETFKQQVQKLFGSASSCTTAVENFSATLADQSVLADVLAVIKGVPGVSLNWSGEQLTLKGADEATLKQLADKIQPLLKTAKVDIAKFSDEDNAVNSSIDRAKEAISAINPKQAQIQDITKALNMQIINFASGSDDIPGENKAVLNQAATLLKELPDVKLVIKGYTDSVGNAESNKTLSQARAQSVATYLSEQGIDASRFTVEGHGQDNPVADNSTKDGQFKNRRIEFDVTQ